LLLRYFHHLSQEEGENEQFQDEDESEEVTDSGDASGDSDNHFPDGFNVLYLCMSNVGTELSSSDVLSNENPRLFASDQHRRDTARCMSVEESVHVNDAPIHVHTVSLLSGSSERHLQCDIRSPDFCDRIRHQFPQVNGFREVVMDYFWSPDSWATDRIGQDFFSNNLIKMRSILSMDLADIKLPWTINTFRGIMMNSSAIESVYTISYLYDTNKVSLCYGTALLDTVTDMM